MRIVIGLLVLILSGACFKKKPVPADSDMFFPSRRLAELNEKKLEEVSGLAASKANPGLLWTHNDSGNPAIVFLIDESLRIRLSCKLKGIENRDWEDIAVGPGPDENKTYVYIADIGDNNARYPVKYIYRFEEPLLEHHGDEVMVTSFDTIAFRLEDGRKDTEAILVHPETGNIYLVSKREKPVHVYELVYPFEDNLVAERIASLPLTQIVAGDFSDNGGEILMKDYDNIYYWDVKGLSLSEALKEKPAVLNYTVEPQGEAITFSLDGSGFYTLSEKIKGEKTFLYFYERKKP